MRPATEPRPARQRRLLEVNGPVGRPVLVPALALPTVLSSGDLVVLNDASTFPGRFSATNVAGVPFEIRVASVLDDAQGVVRLTAALVGAGDASVRTEDRTAPPSVAVGDTLRIAETLAAHVLSVSSISNRLVTLEITLRKDDGTRGTAHSDEIWWTMYREGRVVQYAHVHRPLALWDVQSSWAMRPWAVEVPSAGLLLSAETILALRDGDIEVATITHAAGLSATGDDRIDAHLPLAERFEVSEEAAAAVRRTQARGGRVIAVGTSVVRALESAARERASSRFEAASGVTEYVLGPSTLPSVVDGILTGIHESGSSHLRLLEAFATRDTLECARKTSEREGFLGHEFGDAWLVWSSRSFANAATPSIPSVASRGSTDAEDFDNRCIG